MKTLIFIHTIMNLSSSHTTVLSLCALTFMTFAATPLRAADGPPPKGWGGNSMNEYKRGIDSDMVREGHPSAFIEAVNGNAQGFGTMTQFFKAADYLGKRVRFSGFIKTQEVTGRAALWLRIDSADKKPLGFDNMEKRAVTGTTDWTKVSIVLDVPAGADAIGMGVLLSGRGRLWVNSLSFEVVEKTVPVTVEYEAPILPRAPANLDFTE